MLWEERSGLKKKKTNEGDEREEYPRDTTRPLGRETWVTAAAVVLCCESLQGAGVAEESLRKTCALSAFSKKYPCCQLSNFLSLEMKFHSKWKSCLKNNSSYMGGGRCWIGSQKTSIHPSITVRKSTCLVLFFSSFLSTLPPLKLIEFSDGS